MFSPLSPEIALIEFSPADKMACLAAILIIAINREMYEAQHLSGMFLYNVQAIAQRAVGSADSVYDARAKLHAC